MKINESECFQKVLFQVKNFNFNNFYFSATFCTITSYDIWLTETWGTTFAQARGECQRDGGDLAGKEIFGFGPEGNKYFE